LTDIETIQEIDENTEPVKRSGEIDDGVFEFGDLHESGGYPEQKTGLASQSVALRRSQSTGDIDDKSISSNEIPYIDSDHHNHCDEKPEDSRKCGFMKTISKLDSQDTEDGQETTSESVSDKKKAPPSHSPKSCDNTKRIRPKMVRQAPVDLDSDSSESRLQNIIQDSSVPKLSTSLHGPHNMPNVLKNSMGKSSSHESDKTFTPIVTDMKRTGSQRKSSIKNQDEKDTNLQKKQMETYYTLPHHGQTKKQKEDNHKMQQHNKKRRKSHGLTIKIESPTTGEDSSFRNAKISKLIFVWSFYFKGSDTCIISWWTP
jgi:hypothetical protein